MSTHSPAPLRGIPPVLVTPYTAAGDIDHAGVKRQVNWLLEQGAQAVALGLASDVTRLTAKELAGLVETVKHQLPQATPLICACTGASTRVVVDLGTRLAAAGATILMVSPPKVPGLTAEAVLGFYRDLAGVLEVGIIVQDAPQETGVSVSDDTISRLAMEVQQVIGVKLESPDALERMARLSVPLREAGVLMLGGAGGADYLLELELGAGGTLPGPALADVFIRIDSLWRAGDPEAAAALFYRYGPALEIARRGMVPFVYAQKRLLQTRGVATGLHARQPAAAVPPWIEEHVETICTRVAGLEATETKGR